ncbi:MAG: hypothetical protein ABI083_16755 [Lapillicoccus sp.]
MSRGLAAWDRTVSLLAGLLLLALGAGAIAWYAGRLPRVGPVLDVGWLPSTVAEGWWPWACGAGGIVLVLLALRWLVAHLPSRGPGALALAGSDTSGRLEADLGVVAAQAAHALGRRPGVGSASSGISRERGGDVLELVATIPRDGSLAEAVGAIDDTVAELGGALNGACPPVRAWVQVTRA